MNDELAIQKFMKEHADWESRLAEKPYFVSVARKNVRGRNLAIFKYGIESDFGEEICRECRGLILDEDTREVVSYPFRKFGNYGEGSWVDTVDWSTASATEKIDGSLIKVVKSAEGELLVSTNGTIDAADAPVADQLGCPHVCFADVFWSAVSKTAEANGVENVENAGNGEIAKKWLTGNLETNRTYMFELVSPWTKVVVPHPEDKLYFLGSRDNKTFLERLFRDDPLAKLFDVPRIFQLRSLDECLASAKDLPWNEEGYVVVDGMFRRNKIKSPAYLACHHMRGEGPMTCRRAIDLIRTGEVDEVLAYFPEFEKPIRETEELTAAYSRRLRGGLDFLNERLATENATREEARTDKALRGRLARDIVGNLKDTGFAFAWLDGKVETPEDWIAAMPSTKLADIIAKQTA